MTKIKPALVFSGFRLNAGKPSQNKAGNKIRHNLLPTVILDVDRLKILSIIKNYTVCQLAILPNFE